MTNETTLRARSVTLDGASSMVKLAMSTISQAGGI